MVVWVPDWPVHCLVVDLPPGGTGAVVHSERIEVASAAARSAGVRNIGWEWASQQGMDLDRVLVLNAGKDHQVGDLCSLLIEACDVVCLDVPELSSAQQRTLAARARSMGRTIVTLRPWSGLSRDGVRQRMRLVV